MKQKLLFKEKSKILFSTHNYFKLFITSLFLLSSVLTYSQSEPEVLKNWTALEEAEFHFDVSYSIVKCSPASKATVLMNTFNEDGTNPKVGFTLDFSDASGNKAQVIVAPFASKLGDMFIASCASEAYSNLKFDCPDNIDLSTMKVKITYQTK
jgi:hypothetical protein